MGGCEIRWVYVLREKCCQTPRFRFQVHRVLFFNTTFECAEAVNIDPLKECSVSGFTESIPFQI